MRLFTHSKVSHNMHFATGEGVGGKGTEICDYLPLQNFALNLKAEVLYR